ncbi:MAG: hypothetical protein ACRD0U_03855 [Acidimicrobiales bacterium]
MSALVFLLLAVVVSLVGWAVLVLRHRRPNSLEWGIDEFKREMQALSPDGDDRRGR